MTHPAKIGQKHGNFFESFSPDKDISSMGKHKRFKMTSRPSYVIQKK